MRPRWHNSRGERPRMWLEYSCQKSFGEFRFQYFLASLNNYLIYTWLSIVHLNNSQVWCLVQWHLIDKLYCRAALAQFYEDGESWKVNIYFYKIEITTVKIIYILYRRTCNSSGVQCSAFVQYPAFVPLWPIAAQLLLKCLMTYLLLRAKFFQLIF